MSPLLATLLAAGPFLIFWAALLLLWAIVGGVAVAFALNRIWRSR